MRTFYEAVIFVELFSNNNANAGKIGFAAVSCGTNWCYRCLFIERYREVVFGKKMCDSAAGKVFLRLFDKSVAIFLMQFRIEKMARIVEKALWDSETPCDVKWHRMMQTGISSHRF